MNPNYIGLSITDYNASNEASIVHKEIIEIKGINDINTKGLKSADLKNIYKNNKRKHEVMNISKYILKLIKHYQCETLAIEKLNIQSKDNHKGSKYNKLVNNLWVRKDFIGNLRKRCCIEKVRLIEVLPQYSSFIGQLSNPEDIDSVAASLEISRRANLFNKIFITKEIKEQTIIYPKFNVDDLTNHWKEKLGSTLNNIKNWIELYNLFKKSKISYRFHRDNLKHHGVFRLDSYNSLINIITY